jgi:hypothetical protein
MADPDLVVARNTERLDRLARGQAAQRVRARNRERARQAVARRLRRAAYIAAALLLAPLLWGLIIGPIGTTALVLLVLAGVLGIGGALVLDPAAPAAQPLETTPPAALPRVTEAWLEARRRQLPVAAGPRIDGIIEQLATLDIQLQHVTAANDITQDLDRLLKRHLPELVERYTRVPESQRAADPSLEATLVSGLALTERELERASIKLAESDRDAVLVKGRFLEKRYGESDLPPGP